MKTKINFTQSFIISLCVIAVSFTFLYAQSGQLGFSSIITDKSSNGVITHSSAQVIEDSHQNWFANTWAGYYVSVTGSDGLVQIRKIISNTATTITISPAFENIPSYGSGFAIRRGYKESSLGLQLKLYMNYDDAKRAGGKLEGYSCRIQASDTSVVEFVSVTKGNGLGKAWAPSFYAPEGKGCINWLVLQFPEYDGLPSGLYNIATVTFNLRKSDINKPISFYVTNCPDGGLPIGGTVDSYSFRFDTATNEMFSGREEIFVLGNTPENEQLFSANTTENPSIISSYPNPFNPSTTIRYELTEYSEVQLVIYDVLGRKVNELVNAHQFEGSHSIGWEPRNVASGIYFAHVDIKGSISHQQISSSQKIIYAK